MSRFILQMDVKWSCFNMMFSLSSFSPYPYWCNLVFCLFDSELNFSLFLVFLRNLSKLHQRICILFYSLLIWSSLYPWLSFWYSSTSQWDYILKYWCSERMGGLDYKNPCLTNSQFYLYNTLFSIRETRLFIKWEQNIYFMFAYFLCLPVSMN